MKLHVTSTSIWKRSVSTVLAAGLLLGLSVPAVAAEKEESTSKQEVVYATLSNDGTFRNISVVNIFDLEHAGEIVDYGDYSSVRNMTTTDKITYENGTARVSTTAGRLYYEGTMDTAELPWNIAVTYTLDGKPISAEKLYGQSGALVISISIKQNTACDSFFFEHYGLQVAATLDTSLCKNIVAEGATGANVGKDRQLTYMILPNTEKDITISADVTNFEMDSISINGLPLSMDVEIDSEHSGELDDKVTDLEDAVKDLDDGATDLQDGAKDILDGAKDLDDGAKDMKSGAKKLYEGAEDLRDGVGTLTNGIYSLQEGLDKLTTSNDTLTGGADAVFTSLLNQATQQINKGINDAGLTVYITFDPLDKNNYNDQLDNLIQQIEYIIAAQQTPVTDPTESIASDEGGGEEDKENVQEQANESSSILDSIEALRTNLDSYNEFYQGLKAYTAGVASAAQGADALADGASEVKIGTSKLRSGAQELYDGAKDLKKGTEDMLDGAQELYDGTVDLKDGTTEFRDKTDNLDQELKDKINDAIQDMLGGDFTTKSFVSEQNTNVQSVQFVIRTDSIQNDEADEAPAEEPVVLSFWQKLIQLFKRG
jgi:putative membrane protein